jgi:hypothetical protein
MLLAAACGWDEDPPANMVKNRRKSRCLSVQISRN